MFVSLARAIHPDDWLPKERPEVIDLSTKLVTSKGHFIISYTVPEPDGEIPLNKMHTWELKITDPEGRPINDAIVVEFGDMPEHRHGMVTNPKTKKARKPGTYTVHGMKFHMPGWWAMIFDVSSGNKRDAIMFNFILGEGESRGCCCTDSPTCECNHGAEE